MKRSELLRSREYWIADIQLKVFNLIEQFRSKKGWTKSQVAEKLGVTKGYVSQILNGDFDHKMSKLVDLALSFDKVPMLQFVDARTYLVNETVYAPNAFAEKASPIHFDTNYVVIHSPDDLKMYVPIAEMPSTETPFAIPN